ncbi:chemokine-like receptor 1 [Alligator sinensis]|uniref:Chemokine-like receptor 1 n=1 Tax=Alligator sinensis TaxID=38654 RepID=A0A1U7SF55_ALLSI|nr:chemokine-like receptor 1 [Alligator sinensis]
MMEGNSSFLFNSTSTYLNISISSAYPNAYKNQEDITTQMQRKSVIFATLYMLGFLLGITGNGLVIFVIGFRMPKTVVTIWYLNLAVADFAFTLFLLVEVAYSALGFHWALGLVLCKMYGAISYLNLYASVFFLTLISADRCVSVCLPTWALRHRRPHQASLVSLVMWLVAVALSIPSLVFRDIKTVLNSGREIISCYENYILVNGPSPEEEDRLWICRQQAMVLTSFVVGFLVPFILILSFYGVLAAAMKRSHLTRSSRPFKIMVAVVVTFFISWFPLHIARLLALAGHYEKPGVQHFFDVAVPLAYLSSCLNPLLYAFMGGGCRDMLQHSILATFHAAFEEDSGQNSPSQTGDSGIHLEQASRI